MARIDSHTTWFRALMRDLAVQHRVLDRQRRHRARDLRVERRRVAAAAVAQRHPAALLPGEEPVAVVLELEEPARVAERCVARLGEHRGDLAGTERSPRRALPRGPLQRRHGAGRSPGQLHERPAGEDRDVGGRVRAAGIGEGVAVLQQQPLPRRPGPDQRPLAAQLVAPQLEEELPGLVARVRIRERPPPAAIPEDHGPGAVVARRDDPLEVGVLDRVILHLHRHPLLRGVGGGALRDGPGAERSVQLQPEVPVKPAGGVLLHDEEARPRRVPALLAGRAKRLGRPPGVPLSAVGVEPIGHAGSRGAVRCAALPHWL